MVDFRAMPPMDEAKRREAITKVTKLLNGAQFNFVAWTEQGRIRGQYRDYSGDWTTSIWSNSGKVSNREFEEFDIDWSSARNA